MQPPQATFPLLSGRGILQPDGKMCPTPSATNSARSLGSSQRPIDNKMTDHRSEMDGSYTGAVPRFFKLEFPRYDGKDDPLPWLTRCERFFHG